MNHQDKIRAGDVVWHEGKVTRVIVEYDENLVYVDAVDHPVHVDDLKFLRRDWAPVGSKSA